MGRAKTSRPSNERPSVAVLYTRVSTVGQVDSGLSLEQQERSLRQAATAAGYEDLVLLSDEGVSGKSMQNRPALRQALDLLADGSAGALFVSKMDRLGRKTRDALDIVDLADAQGWRLVALDLGLDTASPVGRLVLTILAAVAEMELQRISERHRDWHAAKRARGSVWGVDEGPRSSVPIEVRRRVLANRHAGMTLQAIADSLNADGIATPRSATWSTSNVAALIESPASAAVGLA